MESSMTDIVINEFAVRPELLRQAVAQHRSWIEQQLGASLPEAVILETDLDIAQIGIELLLPVPPATVGSVVEMELSRTPITIVI
jgi:hypothetical protein